MHSVSGPADQRPDAKTNILMCALELFAKNGVHATPIRAIAEAAGTSQGLVIHHYGTKNKLRKAVDDYVLGLMKSVADASQGVDVRQPVTSDEVDNMMAQAGSPWTMFGDSPLTSYLKRMVTDEAHHDSQVVQKWHSIGREALRAAADQGTAFEGDDPEVRVAVLLSLDLATLILRDQLTQVLGTDPLGHDGAQRWLTEVHQLLQGKYFPPTDTTSTPSHCSTGDSDTPLNQPSTS